MFRKEIDLNAPGKENLLVICGLHGNESNAVKTTLELLNITQKDKDFKKELSKKYSSIKFIMGVNSYGLKNNIREYKDEWFDEQGEYKDLNRIFDFSNFNDNSEQIKRTLLYEISEANIVIDIHNSPWCKSMLYISPGNNSQRLIDIAKKNNFNYLYGSTLSNGVLKNYVNSERNKLGVTVELGHMGINKMSNISKDVDFLKNILLVITDDNYDKNEVLSNANFAVDIISPAEGVLYYTYEDPLVEYKKGDVIAIIKDYDYNTVGIINAPFDGKLISLINSVYTANGKVIGSFQGE